MVKKILLLLLVLFYIDISYAQVFEFSNISKLPPTVNSNGEESMPLLSPDQSRLYFVRSIYDGNLGGKYSGQDIWCSEKTITGWKSANNKIKYINDRDNNVLIGLNSDGRTMYTLNSSPSAKLQGIYFSKLNDKGWSEPEFIPIPGIDNQDFVGMFVSPDYDVIFLSMRGGDNRGEEDLYVSIKSSIGEWSKPKNIGNTINTAGFEVSPFLSADKKRLFFSSNGHGGLGDADIFYSERLYNSWETWSAPVNLGAVVNSKKFDAYFSIYGDTVAYFTSNRDQQLSDIFKVDVSATNALLPSGKKYLTQAEWNSTVGKNVLQQLTFQNRNKTLTSAQKELLYFIAKKISDNKDIGIHLVVKQEEDADLTKTLLKEIYGELRQAGIDSNRIWEEQLKESIKVSENTSLVDIMLYK